MILTAAFSAVLLLGGTAFAQSNLAKAIRDMSTPDNRQQMGACQC